MASHAFSYLSPGNRPSRFRQTRSMLWIGFSGLLLLLCALGVSSVSFLYQIELRHEQIRQQYVRRDRTLEKLRASIYVSGTFFRDFILDRNNTNPSPHKERFTATRLEVWDEFHEYMRLSGAGERIQVRALQAALKAYFDALDPALAWTPPQRELYSYSFIQESFLPKRTAALDACDRVQQHSQGQLERDGEAVSEMFSSFRIRLLTLLLAAVCIGVAIVAVTMWRLGHFERLSHLRFHEVVQAQEKLKQLSADLVSAQEDERRRISRELHDEVGQVLSAIMLGLGNVRSALGSLPAAAAARRTLEQIEDMTGESALTVRNLSLLLRPTMLDDLGLVAALKWLARETSRTSSVQVDVLANDSPDFLPEEHRTCVYRVVQEALRNAARHSGAHNACISVESDSAQLHVSVKDDGNGFDPQSEKGMGILGMEERVKRLGGSFYIRSNHGQGTEITFELALRDVAEPATLPHEISPLRTA